MAAAAGCGGGGDHPGDMHLDAAIDMGTQIMVDAPSVVVGTWKDTYHTNNGDIVTPSCAGPAAVHVDPTSGAPTTYNGACKTDGSFKIDVPDALATYYLKLQGAFYETDKRSGIEVSQDRLGRSGASAISGVTLHLTVNNMQPWTTSDSVVGFGANIGYRQTLSFTSGEPTASSTSINGVVGWSGYQIDSSKGDQLQIVQLGKHTTGSGIEYQTLDRAFYAPTFTMSNNTEHNLTGSFTSPDPGSLALAINVDSFTSLSSGVAPAVVSKSLQGVAFAAVSTSVIESPALVSFVKDPTGISSIDFGTVAFGDPFPSSWSRLVRIQLSHLVQYTFNSRTGSLTAVLSRVMTKNAAAAGIVSANLGPVTNLKLDSDDALTADTISQVPVVSWSAPSIGTPTDYEIQVYEADSNGSTLTFSSVLKLVTKSTSVRIPDGYLLGQRQYVFLVRARIRAGGDIATTPLYLGTEYSVADVLSALVTTGS